MNIAYLLFVYRNPRLVNKLIQHLACENCSFFVHVDQKSNIEEFAGIRGENVTFADKRLPVYWGEFSGIESILLLIQQALTASRSFDRLVLLSGSESVSYTHLGCV